jgi:hypothetical protein
MKIYKQLFIVFFLLTIIPFSFADTWVDEDGLMDVSIEIWEEGEIYEYLVTIRDYNNFEYFDYIYEQIIENKINDENLLILKVGMDIPGFDGEASDIVFHNKVEAFEENGYKTIRLQTFNSIYMLYSYKYFLEKGMNMRMSVQDNNRFFAVTLSKWHELDEAVQEKLSRNEVNNL